jgi:hypothetical protein
MLRDVVCVLLALSVSFARNIYIDTVAISGDERFVLIQNGVSSCLKPEGKCLNKHLSFTNTKSSISNSCQLLFTAHCRACPSIYFRNDVVDVGASMRRNYLRNKRDFKLDWRGGLP